MEKLEENIEALQQYDEEAEDEQEFNRKYCKV